VDEILKPETLSAFLLFAVPGVVALYVRAQFLTGRLPPLAEGLVAYITFSLIYHAVAYPVAYPLYAAAINSPWSRAGWFVLLFLGPALLGAVLGLDVRRGWTKRLLRRAGIQTVHPVECAWDWHFGRCREGWVLAVLKDGTRWAGYLGLNSFISSNPAERDIFIERVYEVQEDGKSWEALSSSVWIAQGELQSIEFWPPSGGS
jgi:uncharacterized protein DUF6338